MRILIVAATQNETRFVKGMTIPDGKILPINEFSQHKIDVLITGVGVAQSVFWLTQFANGYDLVINIGIAGSYKKDLPVGSVVCIKEDVFGDYGIDDNGTFRSLSEIKLLASDSIFLDKGVIVNPWVENRLISNRFNLVKGITLAQASGSKEVIDKILSHWNPDIETMEGAAVFYVCRMLNIRFVCLRAISNYVEPRDRAKWKIEESIQNLDKEVRYLIENLK